LGYNALGLKALRCLLVAKVGSFSWLSSGWLKAVPQIFRAARSVLTETRGATARVSRWPRGALRPHVRRTG